MKTRIILVLTAVLLISNLNSFAQGNIEISKPPVKEKKSSEGEMKTYVMVLLKKGPDRTQSKDEVAQIQKAHLEHLLSMQEQGIVLMAGPFTDEHDIKGILIMNTDDVNAIKDIVESDPAIKSGRLIAEYHRWYTRSGTITLP